MLNLGEIKLAETLPQSISSDEQVQNICKAIEQRLWEIKKQSAFVLLLPRLNELSEALVDALAWEYHVDFYTPDLAIEKKRALVREAIAWHRIKGTPAAVESVCTAVFQSASVEENWQYGGQPYHFKVKVVKEAVPNEKVIDMLIEAINATKNTRSWLDEIDFYREMFHIFYVGVPMSRLNTIDAWPSKLTAPKLSSTLYMSNAFTALKRIDASYPKYDFPDDGVEVGFYTALIRSLYRSIDTAAATLKAPVARIANSYRTLINSFRRIDIYV